jgi:predicted MPP superfamily phosphohydrolase
MGIRFDLATANWIAYLIQPRGSLPPVEGDWSRTRAVLEHFLDRLSEDFMSSPWVEHLVRQKVQKAQELLQQFHGHDPAGIRKMLHDLQQLLADRPWTALIIPSARDDRLDRFVCSRDFLREVVDIRTEDPGLILQIDDHHAPIIQLTDVFPAFRTALAKSADWPGVLLWTPQGDSVFLPFLVGSDDHVRECAHWIFSHLATSLGLDLEIFRDQYFGAFRGLNKRNTKRLTIVQLSDLHIGSTEANQRLGRVEQLVRNLIDELGEDSRVLMAVTGDLLDSPDESQLDRLRSFLTTLESLGCLGPKAILGNHDVRKDGYLTESFRSAVQLTGTGARVEWFDDFKVGLICLNSVIAGKLARGYIGQPQLLQIGNDIDKKKKWNEYALIAMMHHHPIPVERPEWYARAFYERVFGNWFEKTESLEDAESFLQFAEARKVAAIIHGHKHIPRFDRTGDKLIPVIGCGSTVGKVTTTDRSMYMSINVITIDQSSRQVTARLLAERIPGAGLVEPRRHELVSHSKAEEDDERPATDGGTLLGQGKSVKKSTGRK